MQTSSIVTVPKFHLQSFWKVSEKTTVSESVSVLHEQFIPTLKVTPLKIHLKTTTSDMINKSSK